MIAASPAGPLVEFFQMVPNQRPPQRADRAVGGVIPARALRYCEAITSASAFGWYVFLPVSFKVVWDGHDMLWTYDGVQEWLPLTRDAVQYPQFSERFNEIAPASVRGFSPPFLTPSIQPGGLQVWTGCIAKSAPGWSLLVRGVANRRTDRVSKRHSVPASSTGSQGSACRQVPAELHCKEPGAAISGKLGSLSTHGSHAKCRSRKKTGPVCRFGAEKGPPPPQSGYECRLDGGSRIAFAS